MADPYAILLVPTEAGAALLADGLLGSLPPMVSRWPDGTSIAGMRLDNWAVEPARHAHGRRSRVTLGLPLRWDGAPVPDGVFRAWNAWEGDACFELTCPTCHAWRGRVSRNALRGPDEDEAGFEATGWTTYDVLAEALDGAGAAEWLARSLERMGLCRVVLLDLVDGALDERAP